MRRCPLACLQARGDEFGSILIKWEPKIRNLCGRLQHYAGYSREDAMQELLAIAWEAYQMYYTPQVHFQGGIWDVVEDGPRYVLRRDGVCVRVARWRAHPIDKRMSAASFVYMRLLQRHIVLIALRHTVKNGWECRGSQTLPSGRKVRTFVRRIYEVSIDTWGEDRDCDVFPALQIRSNDPTPESEVEYQRMCADLYNKLKPFGTARDALLALLAHASFTPTDQSSLEFLVKDVGMSKQEAKQALKTVASSLPRSLRSYEAGTVKRNNRTKQKEMVRWQPVLELLRGASCE